MKKNFFKKLSFVLALAMIVSVLAPAAGVFAKAAPKLNAKTAYLHLDVADKNEFDFNIANKQKGWKYLWSSANENVAEVNAKNGIVTAAGVGSTKVSVVITDKDGEEVDELTATVVVRDNIKDLTITNKPAGDKVAVGFEQDFNRSYTTVAGSTKKTSGITRWSVDKEGATINADNGKFVATASGKYTITARSFQSKAKYTSWLNGKEKYASYVTATATYEVTVAPSMTKVEQVDIDTFKVTFDSKVTDAATKLSVFNVIGTAEVASTIKKVTMDTDSKVATVDMYVPFTEKATVIVKYPEMANVQFVAATTEVADVTKLEITTTTAEIGIPKALDVKFLNKDGVNIADTDLVNRLTWASSNLSAPVNGGKLSMYRVGDTTTLTVTFHTYKYDTTTGTEIGNITETGVVTCVDKAVANTGSLNAYTVITAGTPNYSDAKHSVAVGDSRVLYVQLKGTKVDGSELLTSSHDTLPVSDWEFTSSDTTILNVDRQTGALYPYKAGSAVVVVKYKTVIVGTCAITVTAAREVATVTLNTNQFSLSNDSDVLDKKTVEVTVKDQLGDTYDAAKYSVFVTKKTNQTDDIKVPAVSGDAITAITFGGASKAKGSYTYEVKVQDNASKKEVVSYVNIEVQEPSSQDVYYYAVETNKTTYDMKLTDTDNNEAVAISVFGYASNGVRNVRLNANDAGLLTVKKPNGTQLTTTGSGINPNDAILNLVPVSGTTIVKADKGTYTCSVSGTTIAGKTISAATSFAVEDTQPATVAAIDKTYTDKADILEAIKDCITVKYDGNDVGDANFSNPVYVGEIVANSNGSYTRYVKEVTYIKAISGLGNIVFTVPVNATITYNYQ